MRIVQDSLYCIQFLVALLQHYPEQHTQRGIPRTTGIENKRKISKLALIHSFQYENTTINLKPQSHCHVSTATFCYVLKCYVSCHFLWFFYGLCVSLRIYYAFLRTVTFCHGLLETLCYASLRFTTYVLRFTTLRYLLVRFSTFQLRSITFEVRFDTFMLRFSTSYYVTIKQLWNGV
jgi:hypothetical protein